MLLLTLANNKQYEVYSDSRSALKAVCNKFSSRPVIYEIYRWIEFEKSRSNTISFCWEPSYVGIDENEIADLEARNAVTVHRYVPRCKLTFKDYL